MKLMVTNCAESLIQKGKKADRELESMLLSAPASHPGTDSIAPSLPTPLDPAITLPSQPLPGNFPSPGVRPAWTSSALVACHFSSQYHLEKEPVGIMANRQIWVTLGLCGLGQITSSL